MVEPKLSGFSKIRIWNVNSTATGGGVAEILYSLLPYARDAGVDARWLVIEGDPEFYAITKRIHNGLHGLLAPGEVPGEADHPHYAAVSAFNAVELRRFVKPGDLVILHDPQTAGLVSAMVELGALVIWRCHIDVSRPRPAVWDILKPLILRYDAAVYSSPSFAQRMEMRQVLIAPSIDPLSDKNRELAPEEISQVMERLNVPRDLPIVTQVSRFDRLKDPLGVLDAFRRVRRSVKCRLVLVGGPASDDPDCQGRSRATGLIDPVLTLNDAKAAVQGTIPYNHYLVYSGGASAKVYSPNWKFVKDLPVTAGGELKAVNGNNTFGVSSEKSPNAWLSSRIKVKDVANMIVVQKPKSALNKEEAIGKGNR